MVKPFTHSKEKDLLSNLSKTLLFEGYVAGFQYYSNKDTEWGIMRQPIKLVRNSANEYDEFATAVFAGDTMIGYVPREVSKSIAEKLESDEVIEAELVEVDPSATDQKKVLFRIWNYNYEETA
ncbi:HIRAN domain-containing protein [Flammeovirga sp. OC4]|uniref:HIRAN domain-containing protein n=1 Tax=Flammeovirga sp. OC4 TaxID=1382345 RepID=UPI0005C5BE42|nr:HIRAN domain-containing protein [Flammeovirga sp. OC4]